MQGNLHQTAYRVASHAEVMFQTHLCGIFNLSGTASEKLAGGTRRHGAGHSHLSLTADIGS